MRGLGETERRWRMSGEEACAAEAVGRRRRVVLDCSEFLAICSSMRAVVSAIASNIAGELMDGKNEAKCVSIMVELMRLFQGTRWQV